MSNDRPTRDSMSIKEATISIMWEMAAVVEVLERKGLCTKHDRYDLITEFCGKNPRAKAEVGANTMAMARPIPEKCCPTNRAEQASVASQARWVMTCSSPTSPLAKAWVRNPPVRHPLAPHPSPTPAAVGMQWGAARPVAGLASPAQ